MFLRINPHAATLHLTFDGKDIPAAEGESIAAALLAAGFSSVREMPVSAAPRAPFCFTGICFDCLVEIDGIPNRLACMIQVSDGMIIRRQLGARDFA
ncbi:MAG: (2Fe-2S)-binding protein [Acetobacteraceae bacterium]|nr:(2Fe-2S)-binding protein [Acetobacteraceae bacterium]